MDVADGAERPRQSAMPWVLSWRGVSTFVTLDASGASLSSSIRGNEEKGACHILYGPPIPPGSHIPQVREEAVYIVTSRCR